MQRITRTPYSRDDQEKNALLSQYEQLLALLKPHVSARSFSILAKPVLADGQAYLGWYTELEGQPLAFDVIADSDHKQQISHTLNARLDDIDVAVKQLMASSSLTPEQKQLLTAWLPRIKSLGNPVFVVNDEPVIVNALAEPILPKPVVAPMAATAGFWRWRRIVWLLLLLLALLGLLWYFFCPLSCRYREPVVAPAVIAPRPAEPVPEAAAPVPEPVSEPVPVTQPDVTPELVPEQPPTPPVQPAPVVKNPTNCIAREQVTKNRNPSKMVMIFDNSASMNLTLAESQAEIDKYLNTSFRFMTRQDAERYHDRMTRKPNRLSSSKEVALSSIGKIQSNVDIALVTLSQCPKAETTGFYGYPSRGVLKNKISSLTPLKRDSATPLYSGVKQASLLLDGVNRDDYILIISDGHDNCTSANICTLANSIAMQKPRLKINIVDIAGQHKIDCVAKATGGNVYIAKNHTQVIKQMNKAVANMAISRPICK